MSGQQGGAGIGSLVGMIAGSLIPYIGWFMGPILGMLGGITGGLVGGAISPTDPDRNEQETLGGLNVQVSALGTPIPQYWGEGSGSGNILYIGNRHVVKHEDSVGGKGGGGAIIVNNEYFVDLVIGLADTRLTGPIGGIRKIFADGNLFYTITSHLKALPDGWTFYPGEAVGIPSSVIADEKGVGNVPGYPYLARLDVADYSMGSFGRIPNFTFELYHTMSAHSAIFQMVYRPWDGSLWAAAPGVNDVMVYASGTQTQTHTIAVDVLEVGNPENVSVPHATPIGFPMGFENVSDALWIAHPHDYMLKRIDAATKIVTHVFSVPYSLRSGGISHSGDMWFCAYNYATGVGYLLRANTGGIVATIACGQAEQGLIKVIGTPAVLWVTAQHYPYGGGNSSVKRINPLDNSVTTTVVTGPASSSRPVDLVTTPADNHVWVLDWAVPAVIRINATHAIIATIPLDQGGATGVLQMEVATDGYVWVASSANTGTVYRINPANNTAAAYESLPLLLASQAQRILLPGANGTMWVLSVSYSVVQHFAIDGTSTTVPTGGTPRGFAKENTTHVWTGTMRGDVRRIAEDNTLMLSSSAEKPRLKGALTALADAAGIPGDSLDFTDIKVNPIVGLKVNAVQSIRSIMEIFLTGYQCFVFESNCGLKFRSRMPNAVVATINEEELDAHNARGEPPTERGLLVTQIPDEDLPTSIELTYTSRARDYQTDVQSAYVSNSRGSTLTPKTLATALVLTPDLAKQLAQETIDQLWLTRVGYQQKILRKYMHLEPGDLIAVTSRELTHRIILAEVGYERPGIVTFAGRGDVTDHVNVFDGFVGHSGGTQHLPTEFHTAGRLLNLPAMHSSDQGPRYHVAYQYPGLLWPGASLLRSVDGGSSYGQVDFTDKFLATTGIVASALTIGSPYSIDTDTTFSVILDAGTLPLLSISDAALFAGGNPVLIGAEVVQFGIAALTAARTYTCSRLFRGLRGTEMAISTHGSNEQFTLLNTSIRTIAMALSDRNTLRYFKTVTRDVSISAVTPVPFIPISDNLKPWAVGTPQATRLSGDWIFTWLARSRFAGEWVDGGGFGYDPDFMHFRIHIYADATFAVIKRTIIVTGDVDPESVQTATYTGGMQNEDFGSQQPTIYWNVTIMGSYGAGQMANLTATG